MDSSGCLTTCHGQTCDYWYDNEHSCEKLVGYYLCDCSGCAICGAFIPTASPITKPTSPTSLPTIRLTSTPSVAKPTYSPTINTKPTYSYPTVLPTQNMNPSGMTWIYLSVPGYSCSDACKAIVNVCWPNGPWPKSKNDWAQIMYSYFENYPLPPSTCNNMDTSTVNSAYPGYSSWTNTCYTGGSGTPSCDAKTTDSLYRWCPCIGTLPTASPTAAPTKTGVTYAPTFSPSFEPTVAPTRYSAPTFAPKPNDDDYSHRFDTNQPTASSEKRCAAGSYAVYDLSSNLICEECPAVRSTKRRLTRSWP